MAKITEIIGELPNKMGEKNYVEDLNIDMIKGLDTENMYQLLTDYGQHIQNAINNAVSITHSNITPTLKNIKDIYILGIGGSAMAGELLKNYLKYTLKNNSLNIEIIRWTNTYTKIKKDALVFCCSYSGNTYETLKALQYVKQFTNNIIAITSGGKLEDIATNENYELLKLPTGMMPRCAVFYGFFHLLYKFFTLNIIKKTDENKIKKSIKTILTNEFSTSLDYSAINNMNIAIALARNCYYKAPVIYTGAERLEAVNLRWKAQIQENANNLCFGNYFPEVNHNEINGFLAPIDILEYFIIIAIKDIEDSDDLNIGITNSLNLLREEYFEVIEVVVAGETLLERIIRLVCLADWTSFYLAIISKKDPTPIPLIARLKRN